MRTPRLSSMAMLGGSSRWEGLSRCRKPRWGERERATRERERARERRETERREEGGRGRGRANGTGQTFNMRESINKRDCARGRVDCNISTNASGTCVRIALLHRLPSPRPRPSRVSPTARRVSPPAFPPNDLSSNASRVVNPAAAAADTHSASGHSTSVRFFPDGKAWLAAGCEQTDLDFVSRHAQPDCLPPAPYSQQK